MRKNYYSRKNFNIWSDKRYKNQHLIIDTLFYKSGENKNMPHNKD